MRVVQLIARLNVGGPAAVVDMLARSADHERLDLEIWTGRPGRGEADHRDLHGPLAGVVRDVPGLSPALRPDQDARAAFWLARRSRADRPDVVHSHTAKAGLLARTPGLLPRGTARVHTFHGHVLHGYFSDRAVRAIRAAERRLARRSHALVAVSEHVRDDLLDARIGEPDQYRVIPPGVEPPAAPPQEQARRELGLDPDQPVVAYVGRLTGIKRPDRLIALAERLGRSHPDATLLVAGGGDRLDEVEAAARRLPSGTLRPLGWRDDVPTVLGAADAVVLTSDNEGAPLSLVEAQLCERVVIATPVGGVPDLVLDGETGLLASEPTAFHEAVAAVLDDPALRGRLARAGRGRAASRHDPRRTAAETAALYRALAG
ncbi:glycosyltransferase family 1 protein [Egibacter rhizosphaerae]|uniref:Glycosyltransferase family 1 protein n=1 Tax=Egibacter rhizosphaerae TaxID=1670831 RepID=A0A411YI27_9ACTN|nr:glycosyltransferase [Egibacter rhizosphaerae]QBI20873.1 glycosyltransferase family 1 protein [Egibacter rhizosphaerae]